MMRPVHSRVAAWVAVLLAAILCSPLLRVGSALAADDLGSLRSSLEQARSVYGQDPLRARELAGETFLRFESSGLDRSIAARDMAAYKSLESTWLKLVSAMRAGAPASEIDALHGRLVAQLEAAASPAPARGSLFVNSLLIILREGFEAILILSAVAASLRAGGQVGAVRLLYGGGALAVGASLAVAAAARALGGFGAGGEVLEGVSCLVAVVVLFFTSYWLISRAEGQRWQKFIRERVQGAVAADRRGGLFLLAFIVVFREGFETVLFYQALVGEAAGATGGGVAVATGLVVGLVLLGAMWAAITWFGLRIPVRQFFAVTGALLYVLAIKFAGVGIRELQEAGWIVTAPLPGVPEIAWLRDWLGIVPDAMTLAAQSLLVLAVIGGWLFARSRGEGGVARATRHAA